MNEKTPSANPRLSVVVASARSSSDVVVCLEAITRQRHNQAVEIIVADCCRDSSGQIIRARFPGVILIQFPEGTSLPKLWGAGIARAAGEVIAITDSTSTPDQGWLQAILGAHRSSSDPVIGGIVEPDGHKGWVDWAAYFCEYGQFMHPHVKGEVRELPGNNVSFKRWVMQEGKEFVQDEFWKTYWCRRLRQKGISLSSVPSIIVHCRKSYRLRPLLVRRFHHARCFAGLRIGEASALWRACYVVGSPLLPFVFAFRTVKNIIPKKRFLKEFILSSPFSILAILTWSLGELWGYLTGPGSSRSRVC